MIPNSRLIPPGYPLNCPSLRALGPSQASGTARKGPARAWAGEQCWDAASVFSGKCLGSFLLGMLLAGSVLAPLVPSFIPINLLSAWRAVIPLLSSQGRVLAAKTLGFGAQTAATAANPPRNELIPKDLISRDLS